MAIYQLKDLIPAIHPQTFVFDSADIIGNVQLAEGVSVWSNASIRGDNAPILIGKHSNIQENCVLHVDEGIPMTIGEHVTVGHQAMLHGCTIDNGTLIGMQAIVLNNARVGKNCLIGAGAIIPEGREIPDGSLVVGVGKIVRQLSAEEIEHLSHNSAHYVAKSLEYRQHLKKISA